MARGYIIFSPISHSHCIAKFLPPKQKFNTDFWLRQDLPFLSMAKVMVVIKTKGWRESKGVSREIFFAGQHYIKQIHLTPKQIIKGEHKRLC